MATVSPYGKPMGLFSRYFDNGSRPVLIKCVIPILYPGWPLLKDGLDPPIWHSPLGEVLDISHIPEVAAAIQT